MKALLGSPRWSNVLWTLLIVLAFASVSFSLLGDPSAAIQYWYLFFSPLLLAAFRFGLRGALVASCGALLLVIIFYLTALDEAFKALDTIQALALTATSPNELQALALRVGDLRARDPYTSFVRAGSGSVLLIASAILVGILFDRTRAQEASSRAAQQLRRFFAPAVVEAIMASKETVGLTSSRKELTVLFVDLRGFTRLSERMEPEELSRLLNDYLAAMTAIIAKYEGTLDKYMGDGIMVFYGDPIPLADAEERAVRTALEMRDRFYELRSRWYMEGWENLNIGIGIHTGFMTVGTFGSASRMQYTVIGSNVNLASRLSDLAEPGQILSSARTYHKVEHVIEGRNVGYVDVDGISQPVELVAILGYRLAPVRTGEVEVGTGPVDAIIERIVEDASYRALVVSEPERALGATGLSDPERQLVQQVATLKGYPLFHNVPASEITLLMRMVSVESFREGVVITRQGQKETKLYVIYRGEALVLITDDQGRAMHVATLGRGSHFGELALLYGQPRNATIRSGSPLDLLTIDTVNFEILQHKCPVLFSNIEQEARRRLAA